MHPMTVVTGVLLGSSFAIFFGLAVVALIYVILLPDYPRLEPEVRPLVESTVLFLLLTAVCAVSFIGAAKQRPWRWAAQVAMWLALGCAVLYYVR